MSLWRKILSFCIALVLLTGTAGLALQSLLTEQYSIWQEGRGRQRYEAVGAGSGGSLCAAGWDGEDLKLVFFSQEGKREERWSVQLPQEDTGGVLAGVYPVRPGLAFVGVYGPNGESLSVYRIRKNAEANRVLFEQADGRSFADRSEGLRLFSFSQEGDQVCFAVLSGDMVRGYVCGADDGGTVLCASFEGSALSAAVLTDETLAVGGEGGLLLGGASLAVKDQRVSCLSRTGVGLYYVDETTWDVYFVDLVGGGYRYLMSLADVMRERCFTDLAFTAAGEVLVLRDGGYLTLCRAGEDLDLTAALYGGRTAAALILGGFALCALVLSWVAWFAICCVLWRNRLPLALHGAAALLAVALLCGSGLYYGLLLPAQRWQAMEDNQTLSDGLARILISEEGVKNTQRLARLLEQTDNDPPKNVQVLSAHWDGADWRTESGALASASPFFDARLADYAKEQGSAARQDGDYFRCSLREGNWTVNVAYRRSVPTLSAAALSLLIAIAVLCAAGMLLLLALSRHIRMLAKKMESVARGETDGHVILRTGNELEGMSITLDSLASSLLRSSREMEALAQSYRRFVPEQVLSLLGKRSIQDVDRSAFASRRMAVMMVWFHFPDSVYSAADGGRLLFQSINSIVERTASIASRKGGTVFNLAYDGYDVVMEENTHQVVSTAVAVQQEVLAFNEGRAKEGLPPVTLRIALDVGDVMLGVVGDGVRMEPTTISSSFLTVKELIALCGRLDAGILCTEAIIAGAEEYGSRYMGKFRQNGSENRVYEVFSGDPYERRRAKEGTVRQFSQAVLLLYSGETAQAKRTFLELAHKCADDGGARYYLYLADQMEKDPSYPCCLSAR